MTTPDQESTEEPTQAVSPGAAVSELHDDPEQGDPEMTDPARAAQAEFPGS